MNSYIISVHSVRYSRSRSMQYCTSSKKRYLRPPHNTMSMRESTTRRAALLFCLFIASVLEVAHAAGKKNRQKVRGVAKSQSRGKHDRFHEFGRFALVLFFCLFAPAIFTFFNALRKDPAVPELIRTSYGVVRRRTLSYLGQPAEPQAAREHND